MNELTEVGAENSALARRYGSQSPLIFTMASDAFPIIPMGFRDMDPELVILRGDAARAASSATVNAVAARFSAVGLANPISSGVLGVVEKFRVIASVAGQLFQVRIQGLAVSALQSSTQGSILDSRLTNLVSMRLLATDEAAVTNYGTLIAEKAAVAANETVEFDIPHVLAPSSTIWVLAPNVLQSFRSSWQWRQRRIVSQEATA